MIPEKISGVPRAAYVENPHLDAFPLVRKHRKVAVGGTFDHLHSGHKILLTMALSVTSSYFVCGVTGGGLQKSKKYHEALQSLRQRMENVSRFIRPLVPPGIKAQIIELNDPYGPTIEDESIDAIVATEETVKGCIESKWASRA